MEKVVESTEGKTKTDEEVAQEEVDEVQFHHTDDNKEGTPSVIARHKSWDNVMEELNKCEVLCANCHQIEHYGT
jgi:hypothetical protein